jgi:sugar transferase (PEP-CTERM/EpsH1 system associated)
MGSGMKIVVLASRIPFPLEKGDKLRLHHQLRHLSEKHEVVLCCLSSKPATPEQLDALEPLVHEVHVLQLSLLKRLWRMAWAWTSALPLQVVWFTERAAKKRIRALVQSHQPDVIYCQLVRCAEYVKDLHDVPKVIDFMDALSAGMHRRSHSEQRRWSWLLRGLMRTEGTRLARYESRIFDYFDASTIISRNDRLLIPHRDRDHIRIVPNGVDFSEFSPAEVRPQRPPVLLFTGNMSYAPNVDAARFLAEEILPMVTHPEVRVVLAGAEPKPSVQALASQRVQVTGWVDDIAEEYRKATLFVAPLRMGTGLQNKVLEAMSAELPCVLSPHAFAPLGLPTKGHARVCQDAAAFARAIDDLLAHPDQATQLGKQAQAQVTANFSWQTHAAELEGLLVDVAQPK